MTLRCKLFGHKWGWGRVLSEPIGSDRRLFWMRTEFEVDADCIGCYRCSEWSPKTAPLRPTVMAKQTAQSDDSGGSDGVG